MEINSVINLLQDNPVAEQLADLAENNNKNIELTFQQMLVDANTSESELFQNASNLLPIDGNEFPVELEEQGEQLSLFDILIKPEKEIEVKLDNEQEKSMALPLWMTQAIKEHQMKPVVIKQNTAAITPSIGQAAEQSELLTNNDAILSKTMSELSIDSETVMNSLAEGDFKVNLKEAGTLQKPDRVIPLVSDTSDQEHTQPKQIENSVEQPLLSETIEPKVSEFLNAMSDNSTNKTESVTSDKPSFIMNEQFISKEATRTMVLPSNNVGDDQFVNIFEQKLMDNVTAMVRRNENVTQIQIDPPELGKIEITIEQRDDKSDIRFIAQVEQTKQLIENTVDKLKLQFAQNGLELGQVDVNSGNPGHSQEAKQFAINVMASSQEDDVMIPQQAVNNQNNQLLDLYI